MKKLLLLLLLFPFIATAEYFPGTVTFTDDTTKTGLIDIPSTYDSANLKFKAEKKADTEKFKADVVKQFTVTVDNKQWTYIALKYAYYRGKKCIVTDTKKWFRLEKEGKINILTGYSETGYHYCLNKSWDDTSYYIASYYRGLNVTVGEFKAIKTYTELIFKDDCPQLAESITKEDYKKKSLDVIVDNYVALCGK